MPRRVAERHRGRSLQRGAVRMMKACPALDEKRDALLAALARLESCAVAFSGGVDSAVVAKAAALALGERAVAVTGASASLASGEREQAEKLARLIGIRHVVIDTDELDSPDYTRNAPDRCYHCKTELYSQLAELLPRLGVQAIVNGANADDLGDYRPGMQAAANTRIVSPLADCGLTKADVRELAAAWGLPVWDKPATPCLSSRIAYGEAVTPERLAMIDRAEQYLREPGPARVPRPLPQGGPGPDRSAAGRVAAADRARVRGRSWPPSSAGWASSS